MGKMFGKMMEKFMSGMSEEEKMKMMTGMMSCCEKMAAICPCMNMGSNSEKGKEGAQPANPTDKPESACSCAG